MTCGSTYDSRSPTRAPAHSPGGHSRRRPGISGAAGRVGSDDRARPARGPAWRALRVLREADPHGRPSEGPHSEVLRPRPLSAGAASSGLACRLLPRPCAEHGLPAGDLRPRETPRALLGAHVTPAGRVARGAAAVSQGAPGRTKRPSAGDLRPGRAPRALPRHRDVGPCVLARKANKTK